MSGADQMHDGVAIPQRPGELGNIEKIERYWLCPRDDPMPAAWPDECPHMMTPSDELRRERASHVARGAGDGDLALRGGGHGLRRILTGLRESMSLSR